MSRKAMMIAGAALIAIVAVWYVGLWSPQSKSLHTAKASEASAVDKESSLKTQVAVLQRQRAQLPALRAQLAQLNQLVPSIPGIDKVIDDVNAVALSSGVAMSSLTPPVMPVTAAVTPGATPGLVPMSMSMSVSGTYFQLVDFITKLGAMPRLAVVDGFTFGAPDKSGKIMTSITARVFASPPAAPVTAARTSTTTKAP